MCVFVYSVDKLLSFKFFSVFLFFLQECKINSRLSSINQSYRLAIQFIIIVIYTAYVICLKMNNTKRFFLFVWLLVLSLRNDKLNILFQSCVVASVLMRWFIFCPMIKNTQMRNKIQIGLNGTVQKFLVSGLFLKKLQEIQF